MWTWDGQTYRTEQALKHAVQRHLMEHLMTIKSEFAKSPDGKEHELSIQVNIEPLL